MQKQKTVEFSHLSQNHKAQFIQFLIKNNICFQEGQENCTAKIAIKNKNHHQANFIQKNINQLHKKKVQPKNKSQLAQRRDKVLREINPVPNSNRSKENHYQEKELKTPTKNKSHLRTSSLSCKAASQTMQKNKKATPKSGKPSFAKTINENKKVSEYDVKAINPSKRSNESKNNCLSSKRKSQMNNNDKQSHFGAIQQHRRSEIGRQKPFNKYHHLFEGVDKGRAVRWPLNMLQRIIEEIYDQIFSKNTQCLQTKNIDNALKTLTLSTFTQQIQHYFYKKFKSNKLASTNLNNMLYSLSYHMSKDNPPVFLSTFEDFLMARLQHQDILYYLFARNVLKKQLKAVEKARQQSRHDGTYFPQLLKSKEIPKLLKSIIGKDNQLILQYKELIMSSVPSEQVEAYQFLKVLLTDFHERRILSSQLEHTESTQNQHNFSYEQPNQQLTFGEQQYEHNHSTHFNNAFWNCLQYDCSEDSLLQLILQKLQQKSEEFLQILASDMNKHQSELLKMQNLLQKKSESLVRAVFDMNKMKWLKELNINNPTQEDMATIEHLQIKLKRLKENPSGKEIGEFCKNILTVQQLLNQLQTALTSVGY